MKILEWHSVAERWALFMISIRYLVKSFIGVEALKGVNTEVKISNM